MEFPISKVTGKISTKLHFENSIQCVSIFRKVALQKFPFNQSCSLSVYRSKNKLLIIVFEGVLKML